MADVFISYSSKDRSQALQLVETLRTQGYSVWIDQGGIGGAMNWSSEIVEAINECKTLLFLISGNSIKSENIAREVHLASEKHKSILPVILERVQLPVMFEYPLSGLQRLRYENTEEISKALAAMLKGKSARDALSSVSTTARVDDGNIHLAVLPFDDLSAAHDNDWFADGMTDELINTLGALEHMQVPGRNDVMYYKKNRPRTKEIAEDLKVRYLVDGSVRKAGEKIRITASLIDAIANRQIWSHNYDGVFDNIFELQDTVAKQIAESLKLKLTPMEIAKIDQRPTENVEAYELFLRGKQCHHLFTRSGYEKAIKFYEAAIKLDNKYAEARLAIANTSCVYYKEYSRNPKWLLKAEDQLRQTEILSGQTAKTLWIRGEISWLRGEYDEAEVLLKKAAHLQHNYEGPHNILGNLYLKTQRPLQAADAFKYALKIEPTTQSYFNYLTALFYLGRRQEIEEVAQKAIPLAQREIHVNSKSTYLRVQYAFLLYWAGQRNKALDEANKLSRRKDLDGHSLFNLGSLFDELGKPELNIDLMRKSIKKGYREIESFRGYTFTSNVDGLKEKLAVVVSELETIMTQELEAKTKSPKNLR